MMLIALLVLCVLSLILNFAMFVVLRGALRVDQEERDQIEIKPLTGRDIEVIRRKLVNVGLGGVSLNEVLNLVKTIRDIQLGLYEDKDPYLPADPFGDIDDWREFQK